MRPTSLSYGPVDPKDWPAKIVREVRVTLVTSADVESGCARTQHSANNQSRIGSNLRTRVILRGTPVTSIHLVEWLQTARRCFRCVSATAAAKADSSVVAGYVVRQCKDDGASQAVDYLLA